MYVPPGPIPARLPSIVRSSGPGDLRVRVEAVDRDHRGEHLERGRRPLTRVRGAGGHTPRVQVGQDEARGGHLGGRAGPPGATTSPQRRARTADGWQRPGQRGGGDDARRGLLDGRRRGRHRRARAPAGRRGGGGGRRRPHQHRQQCEQHGRQGSHQPRRPHMPQFAGARWRIMFAGQADDSVTALASES